MGLFTGGPAEPPLAERLRPARFEDVVGQDELVGPGGWLRRAAEARAVPSVVLYGPPGSGKTTIARLLAEAVGAVFRLRHATDLPLPALRALCEEGRALKARGVRLVAMIDEVHRLNRVQQDTLLSFLEDGSLLLVGATTENPYYDLSPALRSRLRLARVRPLDEAALLRLAERALADPRGLGPRRLRLEPSAGRALVRLADGDARRLLNVLEDVARGREEGGTIGTEDVAKVAMGELPVRYGDADEHFAAISAFIKSVRGGDEDAAMVWLAQMLTGGEPPRYVARRLVVLASEDVGLADPQALPLASAAAQAVEFVGMPEAAIVLAHATLYLARAGKSRLAVDALGEAEAFVAEHGTLEVPRWLTNPTAAERRDLDLPVYRLPDEGGAGQSYWPEGLPRRPIVRRDDD